MANYERFQILSSGTQNFFLPEGPVWVSRYQLSLDLESGKRLLQTRMVNLSQKEIRQLFFRVVCSDAKGQLLTTLQMVPVPTLRALPGKSFGDSTLVELTPSGVVFAEVYVQRVRFSDDTTWDEPDPRGYLAFPAPKRVGTEDPHGQELARRALQGGVRNDYYFRTQRGMWQCTCGLPNGDRTLRCPRCGARRDWLESHMDPVLLDAPEPEKAPAPAPAPPVQTPVIPAPVTRQEYYVPVAGQPTIVVQTQAPEPEEVPRGNGGRIAAIAAAVVLFLGLGVFCAYQFLMPYLRYQEAVRAQQAGNYDQAVEIYEGLEDYKDSVRKAQEAMSQKALALMGEGKYQEALNILETLSGYDNYVADCIYSLGVLAFNEGDPDRALTYVEQLRSRFPDYDKTETLRQYCVYSQGNREATAAAEEMDPDARIMRFNKAAEYFAQAGDYEDSANRILECRYRVALEYEQRQDWTTAINAFGQLGDFKDSQKHRQDCMFNYASEHLDAPDQISEDYLKELAENGYNGAQELLARYNGEGYVFQVTLGPQNNTGTLVEVTDLSDVYIHYGVERKDADGAVLVLLLYTLPDGRQGRGLLNNDRTSTGARAWTDFPFPTDCTISGTVRLVFYDSMRGETVEPLDTVEFQYRYNPVVTGAGEGGAPAQPGTPIQPANPAGGTP